MMVVPFVEPPVGHRTRPFIIFFLRSMVGSSQLPAMVAVAENMRTFCGARTLWGGGIVESDGIIDGLGAAEEDIVRERNAPSKLGDVLHRIVKLAGLSRYSLCF